MLPTDDFSAFEKSILLWMRDKYRQSALTAQINNATFRKREWTKAGYYVSLDVSRAMPMIDVKAQSFGDFDRNWPIHGPLLPESEEIEYGGFTMLWGDSGYITTLEMVAIGNKFAEDPAPCELHEFKRASSENNDV